MVGQKKLIAIHEHPKKILEMLIGQKSKDYSVAAASSGSEGMKLAKDILPDMILLDEALPDGSGLELCRQIKSDPLLSQCLVILFDGAMTLADSQAEAIEAFTDCYIAGTVSGLELALRIQAAFRFNSTRDAVKSCEKGFRLMYEKARVPHMMLDEAASIQSVNPAWEKLLGYTNAEVAGTSFFTLLTPSGSERLSQYFSAIDSQEQVRDTELQVRGIDGSITRVLFNGFRVSLPDSSGRSVFCTLSGAAEQSKTRESIVKSQQLEFTATLAGGIAHDFNNLLMSIMGNIALAQLLLPPEDKAVKILEKAESICNQGKELVQQFIILSKCGYPSKKPSSILKLLQGPPVLGIPSPDIDVDLDMPDDIWNIEVDEHQIQYALTHLMTNASEAMPDGGKLLIRIRNITVSGDQPLAVHPVTSGHYLHVMIQDQGHGISSEHLPRIFDPYYTTKELGPRKGMGLGLTTVYSIIHKHNGFIFIASEVNQGTTVDIYLPAIAGNQNSQ